MTISTSLPRAGRIAIAAMAALLAGPSLAQDNKSAITRETDLVPENSISVGVEHASGDQTDRARSGMFNGLRKHDTNGLLDFNYTNRAAGGDGRWLILEGRNLGLDNREASATWRGLGDFNLKGGYSEITRHDPRTINTGETGIGSTNPQVNFLTAPGTGTDQNFELKRKAFTLDGYKQFGNFQFEANFKTENKDGERFWGKGFPCSATYNPAAGPCSTSTAPTALLMLPEPVDSTIRQFDAKINYYDGKLSLTGGYYGNWYNNNNGSLNPTINGNSVGNLNGGTTIWDANLKTYMQGPMALWPDSQAQQAYLAGNYKFPVAHTSMNFKLSYTHATQHDSFAGMGLPGAPGGRSDLGGVVNNTKAQIGFSTQPLANLHVHGDLNYSDTSNKTPVDFYNKQVATNNANAALVTYNIWSNAAMSPKKIDAKLEANYRLPDNYLATAGALWQRDDVGAFTPTDQLGGITLLRQKSETYSYRAELRKTMSDLFSGAVSILESRTSGASSWLRPFSGNNTGVLNVSQDCAIPPTGQPGNSLSTLPVPAAGYCAYGLTTMTPFTMKDNQAQKIRWNANWEPFDRLSVQAFYDINHVDYEAPTTTTGLVWTRGNNFTLDATYTISENWKASAYYTNGGNKMFMGHSTDYDGTVWDRSQTFGAGFQGTPTTKLTLGGDLTYLHDLLKYGMTPDVQASGTTLAALAQSNTLPDVKYELLRINLYGAYMIDKASSVRLDYTYNRTFFNEWTYGYAGVPFLYSDNTTLGAKQTQSVNVFSARYIYKFQ